MEENLRPDGAMEEIKKTFEESSIKMVCRICYDIERENNKLLHPCRCIGSVMYVHEECLKTWLLSTNQDLSGRACELCHTTFTMEYSIKTYFSFKEICDEAIGTCMFIPILLAILVLIIVIIYFLSVKYQNSDTKENDQIYSLALMAGCSLAALIIILIMVYIVKNTFIKSRMEDWKIMDFILDNLLDKPEDMRERTLLTQGLDNNLNNNVFFIQKNVKINGKKIKAPKVAPLNLEPVYKGRKMIGYRSEIRDPMTMSCFIRGPSPGNFSKVYPLNIEKQNATL
ncbi:hypothetical protein SteCoe_22442 [Stentor coeruleus]|uniref:RING-CH-type domain-containing protein n=1 Tax=Stentor coeruleus TaxID=5963 RepID=A0A1R2BM26_9CILI|nr:hypothetical protein SteCoe_22442 [Stentor coeruleus]